MTNDSTTGSDLQPTPGSSDTNVADASPPRTHISPPPQPEKSPDSPITCETTAAGSHSLGFALLTPPSSPRATKLEPLCISPRKEGPVMPCGSMVSMGVKLPPIDSGGLPMCSVDDMVNNQNFANTKLPRLKIVKSAIIESPDIVAKEDKAKSADEPQLASEEQEEQDRPTSTIGIWWANVREKAARHVAHPAFDFFMTMFILINCFFMTLEDPTVTEETESDFAKTVSPHIEMGFAIIFTYELVCKCLAWGFPTYISDNWNRLDFLIVCISWLSIFGDSIGGLSSLRALRVLKPLRTVNKLPQLKLLIQTLFAAGPTLGLAAVLYVALFLIYGCVGLQIWGLTGGFHNRCYHDNTGTIQEYDDGDTICSKEGLAFNSCPSDYTCRPYEYNPNYQVSGYDNIFMVMLLVFQAIALEGWTTLMYMTMDNSANVVILLSILYFISIVILGGFLAANLFLAILKNQFSELEGAHDEEEREKTKAKREALAEAEAEALARGEDVDEFLPEWQPEWWQCECCRPTTAKVSPEEEAIEAMPEQERPGCCGCVCGCAKAIAYHPKFEPIFMALIGLNVLILMMEYHDMPAAYEAFLEYTNLVLSVLFIIEAAVKIAAMNFHYYWKEDFNKFDFILVCLSIIEMLTLAAGAGAGGLSFMKAFRLGRVMKIARVLRLTRLSRFKWLAPLRKIMAVIKITVPALGSVSIVVVLAVFFFSILGMQMFGGKFCVSSEYNTANFDSFFRSVLSVFAVITLDDWPTQMYNAVKGTNGAAIAYFVLLIVVGNFIVFNLLLAVMLTCFEKPVEVLELTEEEKFAKEIEALVGGKGLMMSWETAQSKLNQAEARVEQALVNAVTVAQQRGTPELIAQREEELNEYYRTRTVPQYMEAAYEQIKQAARKLDEEEGETDDFTAIEEKNGALDSPNPSPTPNNEKTSKDSKEGEARTTEPAQSTAKVAPEEADEENEEEEEEEEEDDKSSDEDAEGPAGSTLCGTFKADSKVRLKVWWVTHTSAFGTWVMILILLSCIQLAWETYVDVDDGGVQANILIILDYVLSISFTVEMTLKILSNGLYEAPNAYLRSSANCLDGFIVCMSLITLALSSIDLGFIKSLRALRCIRPLRVLSRSKNMMCVLQALVRSIPGIANVGFFFLIIFIVFGILGGNFFSGQNEGFCLDAAIENEADCEGTFIKDKCEVDREWWTTDASFNNIGASILTLLEVCTLEGWSGYMYFFIFKIDNPAPALFFIVWVLVASFFMLNLFIGIVFQEFQAASEGPSGFAMLTPEQQEWVMSTRNLFEVKPRVKRILPESKWRCKLIWFVETSAFDNFIAVMIAANVVVLLVAFYEEPGYWTTFQWGCAFTFNIIFFVEMVLKVLGYGWTDYIANGWNKFDFFLVCTSLIDILMDFGLLPSAGPLIGVLRVFRIFRVARMMRLAKHLSALRKMASVLLVSLPSIMNVGSILLLFYFMFGVLGCSFFSDVSQDGDGVTRHANFENLGMAMLTLFRVSTGEDWNQIMHDCIPDFPAAPLYFIIFNVIIGFVLINVFVACVVDNMKVTKGEPVSFDIFSNAWYKYDPEATMWIDADVMDNLLYELDEPLGVSRDISSKEVLMFIDELNIPSHQGKHHFNEVLYCLARRIGGVALPQGNLTEQIEGEMQDKFPVYQRDAETVITASQRLSVFKFLMKLKQDILLRKLREYEEGAEWKETCWSKKAGLTSDELLAGAKVLKYVRQMVHSRDPIYSEDLASERVLLLNPDEESQKQYANTMKSRRIAGGNLEGLQIGLDGEIMEAEKNALAE